MSMARLWLRYSWSYSLMCQIYCGEGMLDGGWLLYVGWCGCLSRFKVYWAGLPLVKRWHHNTLRVRNRVFVSTIQKFGSTKAISWFWFIFTLGNVSSSLLTLNTLRHCLVQFYIRLCHSKVTPNCLCLDIKPANTHLLYRCILIFSVLAVPDLTFS